MRIWLHPISCDNPCWSIYFTPTSCYYEKVLIPSSLWSVMVRTLLWSRDQGKYPHFSLTCRLFPTALLKHCLYPCAHWHTQRKDSLGYLRRRRALLPNKDGIAISWLPFCVRWVLTLPGQCLLPNPCCRTPSTACRHHSLPAPALHTEASFTCEWQATGSLSGMNSQLQLLLSPLEPWMEAIAFAFHSPILFPFVDSDGF